MMKKTTVLLDPTSERSPALRRRQPPPSRLGGLNVGLLDISKPRGGVFLDRLGELLDERGARIHRYRKPTVSRAAPPAVIDAIAAQCDVVVEALAD